MQITTDDGQQIHVEPLVAAMIALLLDKQREIIAQGYGIIQLDFGPKNVTFTPLKKGTFTAGRKLAA